MSFKKILTSLIVGLNFSISILTAQVKDTTFSFTLQNKARTSAGVFKSDGALVRTLWSGVEYNAGTHEFKWDGKDDLGGITPEEKYTAKVLSNNVQYQWEGVVGNTSSALSGSTKLRLFDPLTGLAVAGNTIYWAGGYNEGWPATYKTSIADPNSKTWIEPMKQTNAVVDFVCTDGVRVYWSGFDPFDTYSETFVFATNVSDDKRVPFIEGVPVGMEWGSTYLNAIGFKKTSKDIPSIITGLAVQSKGSFLFISRKGLNEIQVLNKITGKIITTLTMNKPSAMKVDFDDNLWLIYDGKVEKFAVNSDGTLTSMAISINLPKANAIGISPDNSTVSITDIATGKVKSYSVLTGAFLWELGRTENYMDNATVYDDKFYWKDIKREYHTFLYYMPDGTLYVGDPQNRRVQHFGTDRTYLDNVMYQSSMYNTVVDPNDPTRLYGDFFEFKIDYSKPLARANGSWKLSKNWGANIGSQYDTEGMKYITTYSNGRTYGRLRIENRYYLTELVEGGTVRVIENPLPQWTSIGKDGSKIVITPPALGQLQIIKKYPIKGFDASNNPVWSDTPEVLATTPASTSKDPLNWDGLKSDPLTSSNKIIFFDPMRSENGRGEGFHLGAIERNSNKWLWRTAINTSSKYEGPFPDDGAFDSGNGVIYAGGPVLISEQNIFWGYHGEFWKQSQTNMWNHIHDSGLFVGQWGTLGIDHNGQEAAPGAAGNTLSGSVVKVNGETYIYHNDESAHGGVHRWKINGLNTINIQDAIPAIITNPSSSGEDLLAGLVRGESLKNAEHGWTRDITVNYTDVDGYFNAVVGLKTYDLFKSPDLSIEHSRKSGSTNVTRTLGANSELTSWKLWGKVNYDGHSPNEPTGKGGGYLDILDKNDLIIARFYVNRSAVSGTDIIANGKIMCNANDQELAMILRRNQPLEISADGGILTFKYANYILTTGLQNLQADWKSPSKLRFNFFTNNPADNHTRRISIAEMHFSSKRTVEPTPPKTTQTIDFANTPTKVYANTPVTITAVASSGLVVNLKVLSGPGSINGNVLSFTGYGTVTVQATQSGTATVEAATATIDIINGSKTPQTIDFTNTPTKVYASNPVTITAVASSGLSVSLKVLSGPGSISGNVLNFTGYGTVTVQATQSGTATIEAATATIDIINGSKIPQTINFTNTPTKVYASNPVTITAVASSGLAVNLKVMSGPGSINGNVLSFTGYGTVIVQATQSGTATIEAATATIDIIYSSKASQTIDFANTLTKVYTNTPITITAIASSGLAVNLKVMSGPGSINGNVLSFSGYGTVVVQATQAGTSTIEAATATIDIVYSLKTLQTIDFTNTPTNVYASTPVTIRAVASSGLAVSLKVLSGPGSISGNILNFSGYGTVVVQATQAGTATIEAASAIINIINSSKASQTIDFTNTPTKVYANTPVTITAVASSGLAVSLKVLSGPGSISGNVLNFTDFGTVVVEATQAGTPTIGSVMATIRITNSSKEPQSIVFKGLKKEVYGNTSVVLAPVASSGLPVSLEILSGDGYIQNNVLKFTNYGTITVQATQPGNDKIEAASTIVTLESKPEHAVAITVYPNPIVDNNINIQLNDIPKGIYVAKLINLAGQLLFSTKLNHSGESTEYKIHIDTVLPSGLCVLQVAGGEISFVQKLLNNDKKL